MMPSLSLKRSVRSLDDLNKICKQVTFKDKPSENDLQNYNCFKFEKYGYAKEVYRILSEPFELTDDEWVEICGGSSHFGGCRIGNRIEVYID
ncbi:MAG: hypothetical protein NC452_07350 [Eubacterium sp.]|nr:hypothetical protein [Eubacterium sp.]